MAYTQAQLDAIQDAYARGVLEAQLPDGSRIKYRSLSEMQSIISAMKGELGTNPTHTNVIYPSHSRGYE
jgi:hypothetical protein